MIFAVSGHAKIYKWVDEDGKIHFSDREDHRVEQEVVNVKPGASKWSRFDIKIKAVDVELSEEENQQIVDGVNNVYEFFDRVMSFDMYRTVPVNILMFKDKAEYRNYLVRRNKGLAVASYGLYIPSEHQIVVYVQENRSRTFETIKHEVSHAVVDTIVPYAPLWLNEGLAEQMEMLERDESGLYFERHQENSWVVAQAREQGRLTGISQFLKLSSYKWRHSELSGHGSLRAQSGQFLSFLLSKPTRRNFVVRLMHNFNRGDRTLAYYLVDDNYIGGVSMLDLDWRRWLHEQGNDIIRF
ncbi:DUF4124 domain-containing protein [Marinobacter salarius]|jgi:hypothetical protein|uniref:DUF4124 domain-containing protein n=2 Tax=Marinobacteraceae TaxID=2887365 RepID=UPI000C8CEA5D|nr:DUF4124 domain-containing protein [Marinobacter salarius]MAB52527.1 DUF4124 domain-containing protein [Marinobacter sp.]MBS8232882.1 DUF4124 domain-containing protein [Marinobacter salarius]MDP4531738.1 DUF4124 domain-containing protein [Marinobacter salarius]HIO28489.1 DUF4124 domain-containing protein [Marinobacter salarius]HIP01059.1 DUF4124 domain-containing protein [Marinobacter salarius]|tara:strand:- start:1776 stop:2669 length:894 start_codon:yes stop_codon:yes gene_type:complete